jgi:hypothetical protein
MTTKMARADVQSLLQQYIFGSLTLTIRTLFQVAEFLDPRDAQILSTLGTVTTSSINDDDEVEETVITVHQYFSVDSCMSAWLTEQGEKVVKFLDFNVWCCTSFGTSIWLEDYMQKIACTLRDFRTDK